MFWTFENISQIDGNSGKMPTRKLWVIKLEIKVKLGVSPFEGFTKDKDTQDRLRHKILNTPQKSSSGIFNK